MKTVDFFGTQVSRLILGDNPVNGYSYIEQITPGEMMLDYYTAENAVRLLRRAQELGVNAYLGLANDFVMRVWRQFVNEGGRMNLLFQSYAAVELADNLRQMCRWSPKGIYHQGGTLDDMVECGEIRKVKDRIRMIKDSGVPAGLGTHVPEVVIRAEEENWGADFYVTCLYNARNTQRKNQKSYIPGEYNDLKFYPDDKWKMLEVVRQVPKTCLVFKLLAGGQVFYGHAPEEFEAIAEREFRDAYGNMKPDDIGVVGVFQRDADQLAQNVRLVNRILDGK
ncbi:MAG: hypothetical protein ACOYI8_09190 [Christensenellales bacterium]|jgi:hypothetical protein